MDSQTAREIDQRHHRRTSLMTVLRSRWLTATTSRDAGVSMLDLLVGMVMAAALAMMVTGSLRLFVHDGDASISRVGVHGDQLDASSLLARDVKEGVALHTAEDHTLAVDVVRDGVCWGRVYEIADTLTVTTTWYEQAACRGPSVTKTEVLVEALVADDSRFIYHAGEGDAILTPPIDDLRSVKRVQWELSSDADGWKNPLTYSGASIFTGLGDRQGTGVDVLQATRALLTVTTGSAEGKNAPVLTWVDPNPVGYVESWVLLRSANPEGMPANDPARSSWMQAGPTFPLGVLSWTDTTLPAGYTAVYSVRPNLTDGTKGPESNAVVTGLRPSAPTGLTATGQSTSIALTWTASIGATGYDVYRDDALVAHTTATSFTDQSGVSGWTGSGYGHSHTYKIVATSRWESLTTTGGQDGVVALGATAAQTYPRIGATRVFSTSAGAFTAPSAPSITATPTTAWSTVVARSYAGWVGSGPTVLGGVSRDRGWEVQRATLTGAFSNLWAETAAASQTHAGRTPGSTTRYQARACNASGCSPWSGAVAALQRPPAPASCTTSGATTRSMTVSVTPAAMESTATGYDVSGGTGDPTGGAAQPSTSFSIDRLRHATGHAFTARTQNASSAGGGWSDGTTCSGTTQALTIGAPTVTARTTRSISASFAAGNGDQRSLTLEGVGTAGGTSATWDPLADGTNYALTARNSDGYNEVSSTASTSTVGLTSPSCSVSGGGTGPNGSITVTATGSNATRQVSAGAGWVTASSTTRSGLDGGIYAGSARATDGYNFSGAVGCGSVTVAPEWKVYNPPSGSASPTCNVLVSNGDVSTALDVAVSAAGGKTVDGMNIGAPTSGSHRADYGTYVSGSNGNDLSCVMWREHYVYNAMGDDVGRWWANTRYTQGAGGAV